MQALKTTVGLRFLELKSTARSTMLTLAIKIKSPALFAFAWHLNRIKTVPRRSSLSKPLRIGVLAKSGGIEDIEQVAQLPSNSFEFALLRREPLKNLARNFLDPVVTDYDYHPANKELESQKNEYRNFLRVVIKTLTRFLRYSGFVQFNFSYFAEVEFTAACHQIGVPIVTHQKEAIHFLVGTDVQINRLATQLGPCRSSAITVYNQASKDAIVAAKKARPAQIVVTGNPRLDYCHALRSSQMERKKNKVVYFLIQESAGIPPRSSVQNTAPGKTPRQITWEHLAESTNSLFRQLVEEFPEVEFVAKGKLGFAEQQLQKLTNGWRIPPNLTLNTSSTGHRLLEDAKLVIGFNTTALVEAIASGVPRLVPAFNLAPEAEGFLMPFSKAVEWASEPSDFLAYARKTISKNFEHTALSRSEESALQLFANNIDGKSAHRLLIAFEENFSKKRNFAGFPPR